MKLVVKVGGRAQESAGLIAGIDRCWAVNPGNLVLVHGGGDEISALQRQLGIEAAFVGGRRVTTERDLDLVRMVLSGAANKRLVSALLDAGVPAWGLSGEDGALIQARPITDAELGRAGTPAHVVTTPLRLLLKAGYLPVVSPVARNISGAGALNVNGDDAAAALAAALGARELLLVSDVDGVQGENGEVLPQLDAPLATELISRGTVRAGMAAKLQAAHAALDGGVAKVRIGGVEMLAEPAAGTQILKRVEALV